MNFPLQIGHAFGRGEFMSPVFRGIPTQQHIKTRWPDGSVKHAFLLCLLLGNVGDVRSLEIVEGLPVSGVKQLPAIDIAVEANGARFAASNLPMHVVFDGPLASRAIFADYKSPDQFRPIIRVHYWHDLQQMDVRIVIENGNTEKAGEWKGRPCKIFIRGALVFEQSEFIVPVGGTWTKEFRESPAVNARLALPYLAASRAVPNFDTSIQVSESAIASRYQEWLNSNKDLLLAKTKNWGNFPSAMGTSGARPDWGCYPAWTVLWLYTGDKRMREADIGNAELACMYGLMSFREGDPAKPSHGRPIRIWDRPGLQMSRPTQTGIKTIPGVDFDDWGLRPDPAHVPNPFFILYLTTGDEFWIEQMSLWVSYLMAYSNGGFRGPTGREGGIPGADREIFQTRGQGLILRSLAELVAFIPDDSPDKGYYAQMLEDCIVTWEGERNINPRPDPRWQFGRTTFPQNSPLHFWNHGNDGMTSPPVDWTKCAVAEPQWEESVMAYGLLRARDLGAPTQPLIDYMTPHWLQIGKYLCNYRLATKDSNRNYFQTWDEVKAATNLDRYTGIAPYDVENEWQVNRNLDQGYTTIAGQAIIATGDPAKWAEFKADVYDKMLWGSNPKWAILPR
jgi:hypothetical protein